MFCSPPFTFHFVEVFDLLEIWSIFAHIFIPDWNFLTKFRSSDASFNANILTLFYLKSETSAHAQICDYLFIHLICKFQLVSVGNLHKWGL